MSTAPTYICRVEIGRFGQWHPVAEFEVGDAVLEQRAKIGIEHLASIDGVPRFRLVDVRRGRVAMTYSFQDGWQVPKGATR